MSEWYEGLTGKDMAGKHVHVVFKTGTVVDGLLEWDGHIRVSPARRVGVLYPGNGDAWELAGWEPFPGIESVSLVWDERDWEEIPIEDVSKADAVVVNGRLLRVGTACSEWFLSVEHSQVSAPFYAVSCALRRRHKLPTEPGFYRDGAGTLYYLSTLAEFWIMRTRDKWDCMAWLPDKSLTPVHFVDGRAE